MELARQALKKKRSSRNEGEMKENKRKLLSQAEIELAPFLPSQV
jgi:hypothetical protein